MVSWVFAINENELADGEKKPLLLEGNAILLVRQEGNFYAMSNKCPHMGCPFSKGTLKGFIVKCPCHDWEFDIRNGEFLAASEIKDTVYGTKVSDGQVFVNMKGDL
ncbi:Rieske (2Fe-2S) protein [Methanolobus halotolerans]|uniref:tRNA-(Guanine-N1)-methyltransferase n=1 Tax=Methanolobus halotolerans TaxID=2052935 RepID=A0A4E0R0C9_9EURY|nr:Rieske (2Fe-2S) protein [Methanolobus halotolerans]TGC09756.1 tRNA-(guanine-N1)-methyltransferase [Methanolobus halotolerans]